MGFSKLSFNFRTLVVFKRVFDFIYFSVFGSLKGFKLSFPRVDVSHCLIQIIFEVTIILVHILNLLKGFVIFHLDIRIYLTDSFLIFLNFKCLLLTELFPFIALFSKTIRIKSLLCQFLDLNFIAVPVEFLSLNFFEPK